MAIEITKPNSDQEFNLGTPVSFEGKAESPITQVELWADDRWLLGKAPVNHEKWSFSYGFNGTGNRAIYAKGLDEANNIVDTAHVWIEINSSIDLNQQLTTNFTLREMIRSTTADRLGIDNTPTQGEIEHLRTLCQKVLQPARDALGALNITSGFRSKELNDAINGAPRSAHRLGYAADVVPSNGDTRGLALWVANNRLSQVDQLILEYGTVARPSWIHISVEPRPARRQILRASRNSSGQTIYSSISVNNI
jgi:hypothetical protein